MPNVVGARLAQSDLKDLGMHTELCGDAYYELYKAGKLTNRRKSLLRGKGVTGMVFGSRALYDWLDQNPGGIVSPLVYVNAPEPIAQMDNVISINNCIAVDLYGQICAESAGLRQISGTGGQLDYLTGALMSRGARHSYA
jgi:acyl-CoA hydrolase